MPDKQNENRFMAMLERRGIVRKVDSDEEETAETAPGSARSRPEADLRSLFGTTGAESPKITPAARQPVPGFTTPIMPGERQQLDHGQPQSAAESTGVQQPKSAEHMTPGQSAQTVPPAEPALRGHPVQLRERFSSEQPDLPPERVPHEQPDLPPEHIPREQQKPEELQKPASFFARVDPFKDEFPGPAEPEAEPSGHEAAPTTFISPPAPPPVESYTERYLDVDELFEVLSLKQQRTDTVYLIEEYLKTLPDSLPDESRRDIVRKIVAASGFDFDFLMGDGVLRVRALKEYAEKFARHTDEYVAARNTELAELEQQSLRVRHLIESRKELHKKQFFAIEAEAQRLKEILSFISG